MNFCNIVCVYWYQSLRYYILQANLHVWKPTIHQTLWAWLAFSESMLGLYIALVWSLYMYVLLKYCNYCANDNLFRRGIEIVYWNLQNMCMDIFHCSWRVKVLTSFDTIWQGVPQEFQQCQKFTECFLIRQPGIWSGKCSMKGHQRRLMAKGHIQYSVCWQNVNTSLITTWW